MGTKKKRRTPFLIHHLRAISLLVGALVWAIVMYYVFRPRGPVVHHLTGYISDVRPLQTEYAHFQGKPLKPGEIQQQFEEAASLVEAGEYYRAVELLQTAAKQAPLPVIFNDIGILYVQLNDPARAINAFREALARDAGYDPVRSNLERLKGFTSNMADPVSAEVEPNNSTTYANFVTVNKPVDGEIAEVADEDYFRLTTPPAPRDHLEISVLNRSQSLAPRLRIFDEEGIILPWGREQRHGPGDSISLIIAPPPNTTFYLNLSGDNNSFGAYTLTIKTLKHYDSYEPNDDIYSAHKLAIGEQIDANIMDDKDTDFYSFESPRDGTVSIDIQNRSATLVPALTTFTPDMRTSGFGPDVNRPGGSLHHTIPVQIGQTYYLQVWSQAGTTGDYSLKVQ
ncbi:Tetratricopeptide TPR_2 repeat protein [Candidatus Sulfopaludibacter sp. SbA3]|nr:Tetratricopeptide TPR_2 repeat protein [Candidatus Sulfopaludibacter sp. SbA3]